MSSFAKLNFKNNGKGWGPTSEPDKFTVPYAPFKKSDMIGRAADFTNDNSYYNNRRNRSREPGNEAFDYQFDEADANSFNLVDTSKAKKQARLSSSRYREKQGWRHLRDRDVRNAARKEAAKQANNTRNRRFLRLHMAKRDSRRRKYKDADAPDLVASVDVQASWKVVDTFEFHAIEKMRAKAPSVEDITWCGHLEFYEDMYERVNSKKPVPLKEIEDRDFFYESTLNDPIIENLAADSKVGGKVFATDTILATLMCASRSQLSWDIVCTKVGTGAGAMLFFDTRDDSNIDYLTVNETAWEPPTDKDPESINCKSKLSLEATMINQNFTQQILNPNKRKEFDEANPFFDEDEDDSKKPAAVGYRYRKFNFGDTPIVCRTELHGVAIRKGTEQFHTSYALNEWDAKLAGTTPWKGKLDTQRGGILANELKNNAFKIGKWTAATILSGADQMKLGFVSRVRSDDADSHHILGTQFYKPLKFAEQINLNVSNMWGVLRQLIDVLMKQDAGKYLLLKDPNQKNLRLYSLPAGTFSDDESSSDDDDDDSDEDDE